MNRDYYKVMFTNKNANRSDVTESQDILDNETEFNANQFKLYDDFATDLRYNFNSLRNIVRNEVRRRGDPNDSGVDVENGNPLDDATTSNDSDLVSS